MGKVFTHLKARIESGYFQKLGVNAIELMPIFAQGWRRDKKTGAMKRPPWGYQAISWYALNGDFGSAADFTALVDTAHARGIAIFVDVSLEHGYGGEANGLLTDLFPSWRETKPKNPWGLLELSMKDARTRAFLLGGLKRLLVDLGVDGIRFDWTDKVSTPHWKAVVAEVRRFKPEAILISENPRLDLLTKADFDGVWDFFFQWEAPLLLREIFSNWDGFSKRMVSTQAKLVENLLGSAYPPRGAKHIEGLDARKPPKVVRYIESHDLARIARPRVRFQHGGDHFFDVDGDGKKPDWLEGGSTAKSRLGATLLAMLPGAIMLFSGQEHGAADALIWAYDPIDEKKAHSATLAHYRKMLRLRSTRPELRSNDLRLIFSDEKRHLLAFSRGTDAARRDDDRAVVVLNFGAGAHKGVEVELPLAATWVDVISGKRYTAKRVRLDLDHAGYAVLLR
ncbi:MAG: alpha amylase C-terminal domain-containing protein [Deltaproteobacteria bacterium]|nr:alpha amylase C-terminal domain-containing protein [Deltaproteobacteria bacterium]